MVIYYLAHPYSDNPKASIKFAFEICYDLEFRKGLTVYSPIRETHFFCLNLLQLGLPPIDYVKRDLQIMEGFMNHDGCGDKWKHWEESIYPKYVNHRYDSGVILLLSNTAFERELIPHPKRNEGYFDEEWKFNFISKGCEKEYTYAKAHHIRVYDLKLFLEGKEVPL